MTYKLSGWPGYPGPITDEHQPDVRPIDKRRYVLQHDWPFSIEDDSADRCEYRLIVPARFKSDGASVPRIAWTLSGLRPDGLIRAAALAHDWLCVLKGKGVGKPSIAGNQYWVAISSEDTHNIFLDLMLEARMARWRAKMAHMFVRAFGPRW